MLHNTWVIVTKEPYFFFFFPFKYLVGSEKRWGPKRETLIIDIYWARDWEQIAVGDGA